MRKLKRITKLERLASQTQLICPLAYENPKRNGEIFYAFCKKYGERLGISITEERFGYLESKKRYAKAIIDNLKESRFDQFSLNLAMLLTTPFDFCTVPIVGMPAQCQSINKSIKILLPKYHSLFDIFLNSKAHEYMHAYNIIVAHDLLEQGAFRNPLSFFCDIEPGHKIPIYEELKNYERRFLAKMINSEKKYILQNKFL